MLVIILTIKGGCQILGIAAAADLVFITAALTACLIDFRFAVVVAFEGLIIAQGQMSAILTFVLLVTDLRTGRLLLGARFLHR